MTEKRCTDCKHTKGIGYDFWCGEGHTEYEVFGAETNCPYYEYHDWSKGTPSKTEKRFTREEVNKLIHDVRIHYYRLYGSEMSLSERLFYVDICETIENQVDYRMELLEKGDVE